MPTYLDGESVEAGRAHAVCSRKWVGTVKCDIPARVALSFRVRGSYPHSDRRWRATLSRDNFTCVMQEFAGLVAAGIRFASGVEGSFPVATRAAALPGRLAQQPSSLTPLRMAIIPSRERRNHKSKGSMLDSMPQKVTPILWIGASPYRPSLPISLVPIWLATRHLPSGTQRR